MRDLLWSPRVLDLIALGMIVEAAVLVVVFRRRRSGRLVAVFLAAGVALVVAMRVRLAGGPLSAFASAMLAALVCHIWCVREMAMAQINDCTPGRNAKILSSGVRRVIGKVGRITEVLRLEQAPGYPVKDLVTVDVPGHGPVVLAPHEIEIVA